MKTSYRTKVLALTKGTLRFLSDYLLLQFLFLLGASTAGYGSRNVWRASERSFEEFEKIKAGALKTTLSNLKSRGWVNYKKGSNPQITAAGKRRLYSQLPHYEARRDWDRKLYLITYDIPEEAKPQRELLRFYLKKLGGAMLQESVWLTPYDPREVLRNFIEKRGLKGQVLISNLGRDGSIAGGNLKETVHKVYQLEDLNQRYLNLLKEVEKLSPAQFAVEYYAILKDDPQLPFELLPENWQGEKANQVLAEWGRKKLE